MAAPPKAFEPDPSAEESRGGLGAELERALSEGREEMSKRRRKPKKTKTQGTEPSAIKPLALTSLGEVQIKYGPQPAKVPEGKRIHARRPLPATPERAEPAKASEDDMQVPSIPKKGDSE
jgi:hypothetical protein